MRATHALNTLSLHNTRAFIDKVILQAKYEFTRNPATKSSAHLVDEVNDYTQKPRANDPDGRDDGKQGICADKL